MFILPSIIIPSMESILYSFKLWNLKDKCMQDCILKTTFKQIIENCFYFCNFRRQSKKLYIMWSTKSKWVEL